MTKSENIIIRPSSSIFVPKAFSPNGDGHNDILYVRGEYVQSIDFMVFNGWGIKVFETTDINTGWDGKFEGKIQPNGNYTYILTATTSDGKTVTLQGIVTLIR